MTTEFEAPSDLDGSTRPAEPRAASSGMPAILLAGWLCSLWMAVAGIEAGLLGLVFIFSIIAPCFNLLSGAFRSLRLDGTLSALAGAGFTLALVPFLFLARGKLPVSGAMADVILITALSGCALAAMTASPAFRPRLPALSISNALWLAIVIPAVFTAPLSGFAVQAGPEVRFFGPNLMDFGNLSVVVNLVRIGGPEIPSPVDACGSFPYHWLFFATPAWMTLFLGCEMDAGTALIGVNLIAAVVFFQCLVLACREALTEAGVPRAEKWSAAGAAAGVLAASVAYFYNYAGKFHLVPIGERNHLMLQLPSSMSTFGNNTLALVLIIVAPLLLRAWSAERVPSRLMLSALCLAFVPMLSITLAPAAALGVGAACLTGLVHRRVLALAVLSAAAGVSWLLLRALGYLADSKNQSAFEFDNGQFLQNIALGLPLVAAALAWCAFRERMPAVRLFALLAAGAIVAPSFLCITGDPEVLSAMSMKNATLVLACGTPLVALMLARLPSGRNASHATFRLAAIALLLLGLLNTAGYLVATPLTRAGLPLQPVIALHADYIAALHHVRATTPRSAVVLDPAAAESADSNPAVIFAARRVILPSLYDLTWGFTNDEVVRRGRAWAQWQQSGFTDESCASALAACADCLVVSATLASSHWRHDARFGGIHVYRSRSRSTLGAAAALPGQTVMRGTPLGAGSPREPWSAPPPTHSSSRNG